jgi:hypothetical protein
VNNIEQIVQDIEEQPFPTLRACLADLESIEEVIDEEDFDEIDTDIQRYRELVRKMARLAYVHHEGAKIQAHVLSEEVDLLLTSAHQYQLCKKRNSETTPILDIDATGISALRLLLFSLPARTNLRTLQTHVFNTLPDIVVRIKQLQIKFMIDEDYAQMRDYLTREIPVLQKNLKRLATTLVQTHVEQPWNKNEVHTIIIGALKDVINTWKSPSTHYQTFIKMLRENGIPVDGVAHGRNLNMEILQTMVVYIQRWNNNMLPRTEDVAVCLDASIQVLLRRLSEHLDASSGDPDLKTAAIEALKNTSQRISVAYETLNALLQSSLKDTYFKYTTETNVYSPVAQIMRPMYRNTLHHGCLCPGKGRFRRMTNYLDQAAAPNHPGVSVPSKLAKNMTNEHMALWKQACDTFATEAIRQLEDLAQVTQNLVDRDFYATAEHVKFREQLERLLLTFETRLSVVQRQFPGTENRQQQRPVPKRSRLEQNTQGTTIHPPKSAHGFQRFAATPSRVLARSSAVPSSPHSSQISPQPVKRDTPSRHSSHTGRRSTSVYPSDSEIL